MNVKNINDEVKMQQWIGRIKECRESGKTVKSWCKENGICEQTYYAWLKKIRTLAVENGMVPNVHSFVPVPLEKKNENDYDVICITKGKIKIELPSNINESTLMNMIKLLLC